MFICKENNVSEVVIGGDSEVDRGGEAFARNNNLKLTVIKADWNKHGKAAGPIRNKSIAEYADAVLLFPGRRVTEHMFRTSVYFGLVVFDCRRKGICKTCKYRIHVEGLMGKCILDDELEYGYDAPPRPETYLCGCHEARKTPRIQ